ncbi:hypothetical protein LIS04_186 [Listeria phage LIS04]|nr:hypothetical protein LIS04_186 [Listeria phage LIS04]
MIVLGQIKDTAKGTKLEKLIGNVYEVHASVGDDYVLKVEGQNLLVRKIFVHCPLDIAQTQSSK